MHGCKLIDIKKLVVITALLLSNVSFATNTASVSSTSISSNPAAVYSATGNGALQTYLEKKLGIQRQHIPPSLK